MAETLVAANFAVIAVENFKGSHGCWETTDVPRVMGALRSWRRQKQHKSLASVPLLVMGPSSGGFFATQMARHAPEVRALSIQVSVPAADEIKAPLPSGARRFPPLQMILMQRDTGKLKEAEALRRADDDELLVARPKPVHANFFSDGIVGLSPNLSAAVRNALVRAGRVDAQTSRVVSHPRREEWRDAVRNGLLDAHGKQPRTGLPQKSLSLAMDSIFARLDLAYAYHASTCEFADRTVQFFGAHAAARRRM